MSPLPTMNRSSLHGDVKKTPLIAEKIVYATLDSLALKRARLPLQLVPIQDVHAIENSEEEKEKKRTEENPADNIPATETRMTKSLVEGLEIVAAEGLVKNDSSVTNESENSELLPNVQGEIKTTSFEGESDDLDDSTTVDDYENMSFYNDLDKSDSVVVKSVKPIVEENQSVDKETYSSLSKKPNVDEEDSRAIQYAKIYSFGFSNVRLNSKQREKKTSSSKENTAMITGDETTPNQKKKKKHFAKKVLHYVPGHFAKRPKGSKKKKLAKCRLSASLSSLKTIPGELEIKSDFQKSKSLSRDELKYVTISSPTNFVHIASATNSRLVLDESTVRPSLERVVITHEEKRATLPLLVGKDGSQILSAEHLESITNKTDRTAYVEIVRDSSKNAPKDLDQRTEEDGEDSSKMERIYEPMCEFSSRPTPQDCKKPVDDKEFSAQRMEKTHEEDYDDVGPPTFVNEESDYDDVGPPVYRLGGSTCVDDVAEDIDEIYDDVMAPACKMENNSSSTTFEENDYLIPDAGDSVSLTEDKNKAVADGDSSKWENQYLLINNEYSSVDEEVEEEEEDRQEDQAVYDDVGLPSEERVNSLYAGSTPGSYFGSTSTNGKESEWEDLEDSVLGPPSRAKRNHNSSDKSMETQNVAHKKKPGQRWSRKTRRQRSKSSRKSSRSSTRTVCGSTTDESTSNDSTYESLSSFQPDHSGTESEVEVPRVEHPDLKNSENHDQINNIVYLEAPTRPTPPPPREASLTQTLGKRMKMLRRTWSITKGSLGRIRRRTSVEDEHSYEDGKDSSNEHHVEDRKYFSFKKHFRKSVTGLSTFYLNESDTINEFTINNNCKEAVYSNTSWCSENESMKNDNDSTRSDEGNTVLDHYSVLTEEPLYQFYAAAAARVAFEMDSDGYEEVEELNASPAATDLAKPGHRTLWCQTPQVIQSGLLRRLSVDEKKIQEAKFEIITSEASYLNSLRVLKNEFLNDYDLVNEILTPAETEKLFGGVPSVLAASERLLAELESVWRENPMLTRVPDVLLKHAENCLETYVMYCSNQVSIDTTLKDLRARKGIRFLETISRIETRPACQSLSLHSFLMLPMQRVTRLPLLADAVLSKLSIDHTDRPIWEKVLSTFSYIVAECNEGARAATQQAEMEILARKLEYQSKIKPIVLRGRSLVKSGQVTQLSMKTDVDYKFTFGKKFNKVPIYLLLLTDYLLVTKPKHNSHEESYTVIDTCKRSLLALEPVSEDSPFAGRHAMMLTLLENHCGRQSEYVLTCSSNTERERWLEAVSPPSRGFVGETLYETWDCPQVMALYSYSASQPDELSLQPGDVINVMRKMVDGWYHGEKLLDGEQGWFPGNYTKEVASEHVRARNLKQRHRLLALSGSVLQRKAKQSLTNH